MLLAATVGSTTALLHHVLSSLAKAAGVEGTDAAAEFGRAAMTDESIKLLDTCEFLASRIALLDEFIRSGHVTLVDDIPAAKAREAMAAWSLSGKEIGASESKILSEGMVSGPERGVLLSAFFLHLSVLAYETIKLLG